MGIGLTQQQQATIGVPATVEVTSPWAIVETVLTLDTNAYAQNDLLADTQILTGPCLNDNPAVLYSMQVLDEDDQGRAIDILILRSSQSLGAENDPFAPAVAAAREIVAEIPILAAEWVDYTNSRQVWKRVDDDGMGELLQPTTGDDLYIAAVMRDAVGGTYTASGIRVRTKWFQQY